MQHGDASDSRVEHRDGAVRWCYGSLEDVQLTLARGGANVSSPMLHFVKGKCEDTLKLEANRREERKEERADAIGDFENSGQLRHAVPRSCPSSGLYVPLTQSTMRLPVHHLPLGHVKGTICWVVTT